MSTTRYVVNGYMGCFVGRKSLACPERHGSWVCGWYAICSASLVWELQMALFGMIFASVFVYGMLDML